MNKPHVVNSVLGMMFHRITWDIDRVILLINLEVQDLMLFISYTQTDRPVIWKTTLVWNKVWSLNQFVCSFTICSLYFSIMISSRSDKIPCEKRLSWNDIGYFNRRLPSSKGQTHLDMQFHQDSKPSSGISVGYWKAIRFTTGELHIHKKRKSQSKKTHQTRTACSADTTKSQQANPTLQMFETNSSPLGKRISTIGFLLKTDTPLLSKSFKGMDVKLKRYNTDKGLCKGCLSACCRCHTSTLDDSHPKPEPVYRERTFDSQIAIARSLDRSNASHEAQMKRAKCKAASVRRFIFPPDTINAAIFPLRSAPAYYDPRNVQYMADAFSPRVSQMTTDKSSDSARDRTTHERGAGNISNSAIHSSKKKSDSGKQTVGNKPDVGTPPSDDNLPAIENSKVRKSKLIKYREVPRKSSSRHCWGYRSPCTAASMSLVSDEDYMTEVYDNLKTGNINLWY